MKTRSPSTVPAIPLYLASVGKEELQSLPCWDFPPSREGNERAYVVSVDVCGCIYVFAVSL